MTINKETFEAWLFSQLDERIFFYNNNNDCLLCKFLKETTRFSRPDVGGFTWQADKTLPRENLPLWFEYLMSKRCATGKAITFGQMKQAWLTLWPETDPTIYQQQPTTTTLTPVHPTP
jgi:hypothetical protein